MTQAVKPDRPVLELVHSAPYWRWVLATMMLRLPPIMAPMAYVLVSMEYRGGPALGGLLVGAALLPGVIAGPVCGRLLDRLGTETWTPRVLVLGAAARLLLAVAFLQDAPDWVLLVCVLGGTVITSGVSGATRTLLNKTVPPHLIGPALSLDSIAVEMVVISAPFLVALSAFADPVYALIAMGVATLLGAAMLHPRSRATATVPAAAAPGATEQAPPAVPTGSAAPVAAEPPVPPAAGSLWRNGPFLFWVLVTLAFGHLLGTADVGVLPRVAEDGGGTTQAAVLTGALGAASAVTGFAYAWYAHRIRMHFVRQAVILLLLMIVSSVAIALVDGYAALALAFVALGLCTAPLNTVMNEAPGHLVPEHRSTEAFSTLVSAQSIGFALAGGLLSVLPVDRMLLLGGATAVLTLAAAPALLSSRRPAARPARPEPSREYAR
ncbi:MULTISPECIES: MFS transporter [unclassified Streptomyces]|uniref:MFS transporter n=1 Tax=unclassified Streptomyces TaxID=2593676 RepID=UPI0033EA3E47